MKIKRFFAKDMRTAMSEVKDVLGPDAVIMSNKKVVGGIEIVAAVDYQAQQEKMQESKSEDPFASLKDDHVQLSSQSKSMPSKPPKRRNGAKDSGEDFAKSLNSFFGKVNAQQKQNNRLKKAENSQGQAPFNFQQASSENASSAPKTLAEQQRWQTPKSSVNNTQSMRKEASASRMSENKEMAKMSAEMASLRQLLEHQVSGLMWQEMERKEPIRAMLIKWLSKAGFSDDIADQLASYVPEDASATEAHQYMRTLLQDKIYVGNNEILSQGGAIALLGPTGVGKPPPSLS